MKGSSLVTVAAVGLGGWWLMNNWATLFGSPSVYAPGAEVPTPAPAATPITVAIPPPATAAPPPAIAPVNYAAAMDTATLIQKLQTAANTTGTLNQDQWNYFRNSLVPPALTGDQFASAYPLSGGEQVLTATDFVNRLHAVGLAGYRQRPRTMRGAQRVNYRRRAA